MMLSVQPKALCVISKETALAAMKEGYARKISLAGLVIPAGRTIVPMLLNSKTSKAGRKGLEAP
jgi:hypothetical protein